jgi:hypothetical protein
MIKTNISRWYDVECDNPKCGRLASMDYGHCLGWALPTQAVKSAIEASWGIRTENGIDRMYCPRCRMGLMLMTPTPEFLAAVEAGGEVRIDDGVAVRVALPKRRQKEQKEGRAHV